ncbi:uncharacterized protein LOC121402808 isoform X4 [Xenopus laevis]|uniref:Uncharacterized protein LOC121402808 isoform X4 n=1 Tax=Xenopus laevis TaxID=8355 RepID=A0A8J1MVS4_XENLA|nr:uncharacterized protein LOC121402808 isoform X4 [Xenopus laevis]
MCLALCYSMQSVCYYFNTLHGSPIASLLLLLLEIGRNCLHVSLPRLHSCIQRFYMKPPILPHRNTLRNIMRRCGSDHVHTLAVFMIDQYLQRHVKLIHTEERNHICDQCRQAFKQQKHLSVHQSIQEQASMPTVNRDTAVGRKGQALHLYPSGDSTLFPWIHSSWLSCTLQPTGLISSGTANLGTLLFCSLASRFIPGLQPQSYSISATINPVGDVLGMKLLKRTCWSNMDFFRCSLSGMRSIECVLQSV